MGIKYNVSYSLNNFYMINQFPTIKRIIYNYFNHKIGFSRDEGFEELMTTIQLGDFKISDIKIELELLLKSEVDWRKLGIDSYLLPDRPEVTADYVKNYLLYCIHDVVWPDRIFVMSAREDLVVATFRILKNYHVEKKISWLFYEELYKEIILLKKFEELSFFNLNHILGDGRGVFDLRVVDRGIEKVFQISIAESCLEHKIYEVREPNEQNPPHLL